MMTLRNADLDKTITIRDALEAIEAVLGVTPATYYDPPKYCLDAACVECGEVFEVEGPDLYGYNMKDFETALSELF